MAANPRWQQGQAQAVGFDGPLIEFDDATFDPWRVQTVRHHLCAHPLLQLPALAGLGERLEARGSIRTHDGSATAGTPFGEAPALHPNRKGAAGTLADVAKANAWMSLLNVQVDPTYRELVGTVLDSIQGQVERHDPGMSHRSGWIFVTSPNAVTPFHFDKEHNFILQVHGRKRIYVWDPDDTVVASEHARDRFHHHHDRHLLQWREEFRARAHVFDVGPGEGAYMPSTAPHLVENGDGPSVTASFTYYTRSTRRDALLHKAHSILREAGVPPPPVGRHPWFDAMTHAGISASVGVRRIATTLAGRPELSRRARFALVPQ
ncbi:cupin-like domain-containing protein [Luteimonas lutimaris]|uniref:JmjC domain-containing protein n=1 Tax=Luteimonas lutimaris TaxID=698645 RepID=A0ABP7MLD8_9GAMM